MSPANRRKYPCALQAWITYDQMEALDDVKRRSGVTKADLVRRAVDLVIAEMEKWLKKHPNRGMGREVGEEVE